MPEGFNPRFDPFNPDHTRDLPDVDVSRVDWNDPASIFGALGGGPGKLPIPKMISPEEVRAQAKKHSTQIFEDWELLIAILDHHGATVHRRWLKRSKKQRLELLLAAWPKMSSAHRPDFLAFRKETERQREAGTKFREAYMWPYVNLEDLSKPRTLLLFVQSRARNPPHAFAMVDFDAVHLGLVTKAIVPFFLNEHTMMFTGRQSPRTYGELIPWGDNDDAFDWMMSGKGTHPGQGLIILEIQHRVLRFLVDCCTHILHDIPKHTLLSDTYPIQSPLKLVEETVDGFASLAVLAAEAPYRSPASLDFKRLESLIAAKKSASEDHIWALREDPSYFAESLLDFKEHRQEMLKDINGRTHPILMAGRESSLWERIIGNVMTNAYLSLEMWNELHIQVKKLHNLKEKHATNISIEKELPEEYLNALLTFQHYLKQATKGPIGQLMHCAAASPPLRQFFNRLPPESSTTTIIRIVSKPYVKLEGAQAELIWLLKTLWEDGQGLFFAGLTNVVDELERLVQSDTNAKRLLSAYIAEVVSDLAVFSETLRQMKIYQPWAQTFENLLVDKEGTIMKEFAERTSSWALMMDAWKGPNAKKIVQLGEPTGRKFHYPAEKRRTKENTEAMRFAECNLDAFWSAADRSLRTHVGDKLKGTALWQFLSQPRVPQRTPEWAEPDMKTGQNIEVIAKPLSELYLDLELRTERTLDHSSRAIKPIAKPKTKGVSTFFHPETGVVPVADRQDAQPIFFVDRRALKVFRTLFYTPSLTATPGEIHWTDFLHAMVSTGFEPEKLYGSVWQFKPTKLDVERSIQFHEPHPGRKVPYKTARRIGRRLERAYGWRGSMFTREEVAAAEDEL